MTSPGNSCAPCPAPHRGAGLLFCEPPATANALITWTDRTPAL